MHLPLKSFFYIRGAWAFASFYIKLFYITIWLLEGMFDNLFSIDIIEKKTCLWRTWARV